MALGDIFELFHLTFKKITKKEGDLIKNILFVNLYKELIFIYQSECMENPMVSTTVIKNIVNDLISTKDYSIEGLAIYTGYPVEVIFEISTGLNTNPTITLASKIIELHALARRELYIDLIKKIIINF